MVKFIFTTQCGRVMVPYKLTMWGIISWLLWWFSCQLSSTKNENVQRMINENIIENLNAYNIYIFFLITWTHIIDHDDSI
jgi:hypothetical protein